MGGIRYAAALWLFLVTGTFAQSVKTGHSVLPLLIDSTCISVQFDSSFHDSAITNLLATLPGVWHLNDSVSSARGFVAVNLPSTLAYPAAIDVLDSVPTIRYVEPRYIDTDGDPVVTSERLVVGFQSNTGDGEIDAALSYAGIDTATLMFDGTKVLLARRSIESNRNSFETAAALDSLETVQYAYPEVYAPLVLQGYTLWDYYHQEQFHLKRIIGRFNDSTVWDFSAFGDSIVVAIVDDGVDEHADLAPERILPGYDFYNHDDDPRPGVHRGHGLLCAGIIAADHSVDPSDSLVPGGGIVGLAPHARILPIKIFTDSDSSYAELISSVALAEAIDSAQQWGADILNCSFAYKIYTEDLDSAFTRAARDGRNGKGCLIIASSGNIDMFWPAGTLRLPAHLDDAYVVGACDLADSVQDYSQYDDWDVRINVLAPSGVGGGTNEDEGVWTLDQMGDLGINRPVVSKDDVDPYQCDYDYGNNRDYFCEFDGTSASAAFVSGVAALLLSYDPALTREEAYAILDSSAVPLTAIVPDQRRGFGRVDALRALLAVARGDCNGDHKVSLSDLTKLGNHLFVTFEPLVPSNLIGDVNCDGQVNLSDISRLADHLFVSFDPLATPCFDY